MLLSVDIAASWSGGEEGGGSEVFLAAGSRAFLAMAGLQEADTVGLRREVIGVSGRHLGIAFLLRALPPSDSRRRCFFAGWEGEAEPARAGEHCGSCL